MNIAQSLKSQIVSLFSERLTERSRFLLFRQLKAGPLVKKCSSAQFVGRP